MQELLKMLSDLRDDFVQEFEEDNDTSFDVTQDWEDNPSFYAGLDRGIELAMQEVINFLGKENNEKRI